MKKKFTGQTKSGMIKDIDETVLEYIEERNGIYLFTYFCLERNGSFGIPLD